MSHPFQLLAGDPALDLVNTLDNRFVDGGPRELLPHYEDLLRFAEQAGLLDASHCKTLAVRRPSSAAARALKSAHDLREALAALLYDAAAGVRAAALATLTRHFRRAAEHRELLWVVPRDADSAPRAAWGWGRFAGELELPVWALALAAERLVTSSAMNQVHACQSETCRWLFHDTSKNHSRRWCDMKICGNRMKARRFQERRE